MLELMRANMPPHPLVVRMIGFLDEVLPDSNVGPGGYGGILWED